MQPPTDSELWNAPARGTRFAMQWREIDQTCREMKMRAHLIASAIVSAMLSATSASATVVLSGDSGGKMEEYAARFQQVRASGETVVIDGTCSSACTMVLGLVPRNRVCATENAVLGFHAAWMYDKAGNRVASASGTRDLMRTYPASVRAWIARNGGLKPETMYLRGRTLAAIVKPCDEASRSASVSSAKRVGAVRQSPGKDMRRASFDAR